jgi:hypothetical protein
MILSAVMTWASSAFWHRHKDFAHAEKTFMEVVERRPFLRNKFRAPGRAIVPQRQITCISSISWFESPFLASIPLSFRLCKKMQKAA